MGCVRRSTKLRKELLLKGEKPFQQLALVSVEVEIFPFAIDMIFLGARRRRKPAVSLLSTSPM